jgi:TPR repeat protein
MKHDKTNRIVHTALCLIITTALPVVSQADPYEEALADLTDGEFRSAFRDFKRLARKDHTQAQYQLGMLYIFGKGVGQDVEQGIEWLKRSAENGSYLAANELGQIYLAGRGVAPDEQEAMKWLELATQLADENPGEAEDGCE